MKKIIRQGTFETNSSSTHSLTFMTKEQFNKWKSGDLYKGLWDDTLYTQEEYDELVKNIAIKNDFSVEEVLDDPGGFELPQSYKEWCNDEYLETDYYNYTTEHGDEIVAVCRYGYDS